MNKDEQFMSRAVDIARRGLGRVSPNPLVGAVLVHQGKIIGEGWHKRYGEAHAEVNAIESVADRTLLSRSTLYVTLEPCSHTGNTPPCADRIIKEGIPTVIVGTGDPDPRVNGKGIDRLKTAGVQVTQGLLEKECYEMNRRFFRSNEQDRPYVIVKWAQTADGFIAREDHTSKWISGPSSRHIVHKWRSEEDAILIGSGTATWDDPLLNTRDWPGKNPLRVVLERSSLLPGSIRMFSDHQPVRVYSTTARTMAPEVKVVPLNPLTIASVLSDLKRTGVRSVIVEGGSAILHSFLQENSWDEARVFIGPAKFTKGLKAPDLQRNHQDEVTIGSDRLLLYQNRSQWPKN